MLTILSPAKTLKENFKTGNLPVTQPEFLPEAEFLVNILRKKSPAQLTKLMDINLKLAELYATRFHSWHIPFHPENSKPALLMFNGEVYNGLRASSLSEKELKFAQDHLRILSGLYGVLRPLDLMQAYRLEMGTELRAGKKEDLYKYWKDKITASLNRELSGHREKVLLNLASHEYSDAVDLKKIKARVLTCTFREERNGKYQFVTIYGKKARGLMTRFIIHNRIDRAEDLKHFDQEGYFFNERLSGPDTWYFTR